MSHFAKVVDGVVEQVIVADNKEWCQANLGGTWVRTSYNAATNGFRKNYAGIGYTYDESRDAFIEPKANCHDEEVLDEATCRWNCTNKEHTTDIGEV